MKAFKIDTQDILQLCKTQNDVDNFIWQLEDIQKNMYLKNFNFTDFLKNVLPYEKSEVLQQMLQNNEIDLKNVQELQDFSHFLKTTMVSIPVISLTIVMEPTESFIDAISQWFWKEFKSVVFLDITVDQHIVGGIIISFKGKTQDYTLQSKLIQINSIL